jgi:hypothetical protein
MNALTLKALKTLRRLFEAESALGRSPVQHVLVVYPGYQFSRDARSRGGPDHAVAAAVSRWLSPGHAPWPPAHALHLPAAALYEAGGLVRFDHGAWRSGFYGDARACSRFRDLAADAGRALAALLGERPDLVERVALCRALCLNPAEQWMMAVHHLGWRPLPGSPLRWTRYGWDDQRAWALERERASAADRWVRAPATEPPAPPPHAPFYSLAAPDLFRSSAFAIDAVRSLWRPSQTPDPRSNGQAAASPAQEPPDGQARPPASAEKDERRRERYAWVDAFIVQVMKHPEWSVPKLAEAVGISPQTVYRAEKTQERIRRFLAHHRAPDHPLRGEAE